MKLIQTLLKVKYGVGLRIKGRLEGARNSASAFCSIMRIKREKKRIKKKDWSEVLRSKHLLTLAKSLIQEVTRQSRFFRSNWNTKRDGITAVWSWWAAEMRHRNGVQCVFIVNGT